MGADRFLSLELGGDHFRVICDDVDALADISDFTRPWHAQAATLPGFQISPPTDGSRMWVLLGSNGAVLARSTRRHDVLGCLQRHLHALAGSEQGEHPRFSLASVAGPNGVVLIHPDLFRYQPYIERQWARADLTIVDTVFAQVQLGSHDARWQPTATRSEAAPTAGHTDAADAAGPVRYVLWTAHENTNDTTRAQIVHALATSALGNDHEDRLRVAHKFAAHLDVHLVAATERKSLLDAVTSLLRD